ncbi:unnamed protein product [Ceutorhynchus assimilis]|uniref:SWIM-type domain-containing protein n=1 Tax=Ceutorhynchus assimilis TaxID=467358 RepID=A0A9N9QR65_9CUCU|nr:unnamed protein product [Ceutorhynchus assimilis]
MLNRSAADTYGDNAIAFVQLKRDDGVCTVKGRITPEHKIRNTAYRVQAIIDETTEEDQICECLDCPASEGGCKHGVAFLLWLHRRTEEPSVTSTQCYWKKSNLAKAVQMNKGMIELCDRKPPVLAEKNASFLQAVLDTCSKSEGTLFSLFKPSKFEVTSLHQIMQTFLASDTIQKDAEAFMSFAKCRITDSACKEAEKSTQSQSDSPEWYELRYGRITTSIVYEASRCNTLDGAPSEKILGAVPALQTKAVLRGKALEAEVLKEVSKQQKLSIQKAGLYLRKDYPIFGASPDGITDKFILEVKYPSKEKTVDRYIQQGKINIKFLCQMQMLFARKRKGLFCVASPAFETNRNVTAIEVEYDEKLISDILRKSEEFWKNAIFPVLSGN